MVGRFEFWGDSAKLKFHDTHMKVGADVTIRTRGLNTVSVLFYFLHLCVFSIQLAVLFQFIIKSIFISYFEYISKNSPFPLDTSSPAGNSIFIDEVSVKENAGSASYSAEDAGVCVDICM